MKHSTTLLVVAALAASSLVTTTSCSSSSATSSLQTQATIIAAEEAVTFAVEHEYIDTAQAAAIRAALDFVKGGEINSDQTTILFDAADAAVTLAGKSLPPDHASAIRLGLRFARLIVEQRNGNA